MSSKLKIQLFKAIWKLEIDIVDVGYGKTTMHMDIHVISYTQKTINMRVHQLLSYHTCSHRIVI